MSCLCAKVIPYEKGQTVFSSGESIEKFGIVLSGQVQVVQDDYYGNRSILGKIDVGNLFGESFACAEIKTLPVSVITTTESELLFIDCHRLAVPCAKACGFHSRLIQNMLNIVSMQLPKERAPLSRIYPDHFLRPKRKLENILKNRVSRTRFCRDR